MVWAGSPPPSSWCRPCAPYLGAFYQGDGGEHVLDPCLNNLLVDLRTCWPYVGSGRFSCTSLSVRSRGGGTACEMPGFVQLTQVIASIGPFDMQDPVAGIELDRFSQASAWVGLRGVRFAQVRLDHAAGPAAGLELLGGEVVVHSPRIERACVRATTPSVRRWPTGRHRLVGCRPTTGEAIAVKGVRLPNRKRDTPGPSRATEGIPRFRLAKRYAPRTTTVRSSWRTFVASVGLDRGRLWAILRMSRDGDR
jgi:hypothetical protein